MNGHAQTAALSAVYGSDDRKRSSVFDAEAAVLAAILRDPDAYWRIADSLDAEDFTNGKNRRLFGVLASQIRDGGASDAVTIGDIAPDLGDLAIDIASTTAGVPSSVVTYAEIIARQAMERRVIQAGQRIAKLSGPEAFTEAQRILESCAPRAGSKILTLKQAMRDWFSHASEKSVSGDDLTGIPTSLDWLDALTGGFQPGELVVIAARPSVGKTTFGLQVALNAGAQERASLFFSSEMSAMQLADRAVSALGKVSTAALRRPKEMRDEDWSAVTLGVQRGVPLPIWIDDSNGVSAIDIAARTRQVNAERRLSCIVIDYLQIMGHPKEDRRDLAIGATTAALKALAKQLHIPVLLLSQLSRDGDNNRPTLRHLRDSGAIEQDADVVVFLHRPDEQNRNQIELIVAKNRNGETGSTWLHADYAHTAFHPGEAPAAASTQPRSRGFTTPQLPRGNGYRSSGRAAGAGA